MGNSGSKKEGLLSGKKSKRKGGDDGCIGNRKIRTITLSILIIAFCIFGLSYFFDQYDYWPGLNVTILGVETCPKCEDAGNAWMLVIVGSFVMIASAVFAILLFFINCDDKLGRAAGVGLIIGGLLYIIGWVWYINIYNSMIKDLNSLWWDALSDDTKNRLNAMLTSWFGEALLMSVTSMLLGLDVFMHLFDDESKRLFTNLANLFFVSVLAGPVYYMLSDDDNVSLATFVGGFPINSNGYPWIATGYMVIGGFSLAYVILYICTCCTCNCKDTACIRILMALGLIVGGVLTSIGYYIYASEFTSERSDEPTNLTVYYVGYTIAIGGCCIVWALDIGVDDIKG
eukprot:545939_1